MPCFEKAGVDKNQAVKKIPDFGNKRSDLGKNTGFAKKASERPGLALKDQALLRKTRLSRLACPNT